MNKSDGFDEIRRAVEGTPDQSSITHNKKKIVSQTIETKQTETVWDNVGFNDEIGQPTYVELISITQEESKTFPADSPQGQQASQILILPEFDMRNYEFALSTRADHFFNWGGRNEKWIIGNWFVDFRPTGPVWYDARGVGRQYYFMAPTGELYAWDHQSGGTYGGEATGTLIALLGTEYYTNIRRIVLLMPEDRPLVTDEPAVLDFVESNIVIADPHPIIKISSPEPILGSTLLPDYIIAQAAHESNIDNVPRIKVTTLDPTGPGSLYEALMTEGERIIVFEVGGVIDFRDGPRNNNGDIDIINIDNSHCVIAGETAPAPGITIIGTALHVRTSHVLIRNIYIRHGQHELARRRGNAFGIIGYRDFEDTGEYTENILVDHCSFSWGKDQTAQVEPRGPGSVPRGICRYITFQNTIISECLDTENRNQAKGLLLAALGTNHILIKRCLFTNHNKRIPFTLAKGYNEQDYYNSAIAVNSIIYSPRQQATLIQGHGSIGPKLAMLGNLFIPGPDTKPYITVDERATLSAVPPRSGNNNSGVDGGQLAGRFTGMMFVDNQPQTDIKIYLNDNELVANTHLHETDGTLLPGGFDYDVSIDCLRALPPFNGPGGSFVANYSDTGLDVWLDKDSDLDLITSAVLKSDNYRILLDDVGANPARSSFNTSTIQYTGGDSVDDRVKNQLLNLGSATGNSHPGNILVHQNDAGGYPSYTPTSREYTPEVEAAVLLPVPIGPSGDHIVGESGTGSGTAGWTVPQQLLAPNYDYISVIPPLDLPDYGHTGDQIDSVEDPKTYVPLSRISKDEGLGITVSSDDDITRTTFWKQYNTHLTQPQSFNSNGALLISEHIPLGDSLFGGGLAIDQQQLTEDGPPHPHSLGSSPFTIYTDENDERIHQAVGATTVFSTHDAEENSQTLSFEEGEVSLANQQLRFGKYTGVDGPADGKTQSRHVGLYFTGDNVNDICGNTILSATLELTATNDNENPAHGGANFEGTWYGENHASPNTFTSTAFGITNRTLTITTSPGDSGNFGAQTSWTEGTQHTIDVTGIVQKLADSYHTLDGIALIWKYESGDGFRTAVAADHASKGSGSTPNRSPKLTINIDHGGPWRVGQSFIPSVSGFLQKIDVFLHGAQVAGACGAALSGEILLEIWEGEPPNLMTNQLAAKVVIKRNIDVTGSGQWVTFNFVGPTGIGLLELPEGLDITAGVKYSFVITTISTDGNNTGYTFVGPFPNFCIATANAPGQPPLSGITDRYPNGTAILDSGDGVLRTDSYPTGNNDPSGTVSLDIEASEWDAEEVFQSYLFPQSPPPTARQIGGVVNDYAGVTYSGRDKGAIDPQSNLEGSGQLTFGGRQINSDYGKYRQNYVGLHFESPTNLGGKSIASASLRLYADGKKDFPQGPTGLLHGEKSNAPARFLPSTDSSRAEYFYEMQCNSRLSIHHSHNAEEVAVASDPGHYVGQMERQNQQLRFGKYIGTYSGAGANARHVGLWFHHPEIASLINRADIDELHILSATLELAATPDNTETGHGGTDFEGTWYGEKNITPIQFKDTDNNITDRFSNLTDASVDGSSPSANCLDQAHWKSGTAHTIDVTSIVQEIVDESYTQAVDLTAIVLIWKYESGDGFRTAVSASNQASGSESDPNRSPKLTIVLKNDPQAIVNRSLTTTTKDLGFSDSANQWETGFQYFDVKDIIQELADTYSGITIPLEKLNLIWVGPAINHVKSRNAVAFDHGGTNVDGASIDPTMARAKLVIEYVNPDYDPTMPSGGNFPYDLMFRTHMMQSDSGKGGIIVYDGGDLLGKEILKSPAGSQNPGRLPLGAESGEGPTRQYEPLLLCDKLPADHIVWPAWAVNLGIYPLVHGLHYNNSAPSTAPATGSIAGQGLQSPSANAESQDKKVVSINIQAVVKPVVGSGKFTAKVSAGSTTGKVEEYLRTGSDYIKINKTIDGEWLGSEIDKLQIQLHAVSDYGNVEFQCRCTAVNVTITTENGTKEVLLPNGVTQQGDWVGSHTDVDDTFIYGVDYHDDDSSYAYVSALNQYIDNTKAMILSVDNQSAAISAISSNLSGTAANNDLITKFHVKRDTQRLGGAASPNGTPAYADFNSDFKLPFYKLKPNKNNTVSNVDSNGNRRDYTALMGTDWSLDKDQQNILAGDRPHTSIDIWVYVVQLGYEDPDQHVGHPLRPGNFPVVAAFNLSNISQRYVTDDDGNQLYFVQPAPTQYYQQGQQSNNFYGPDEESLIFSNDGRHILVRYAAPEQDRGITTDANKSTDTNDVWMLLDVNDDAYKSTQIPGDLRRNGSEFNIKQHNFSYMPLASSNAKGTDQNGVPLADLGHTSGVLPLNDLVNPTFVSGSTILAPDNQLPDTPPEPSPDEFLVGYSNTWAKAGVQGFDLESQPPSGVVPLDDSVSESYPDGRVGRAVCLNVTKSREIWQQAAAILRRITAGSEFWGSDENVWCSLSNPGDADFDSELYEANPQHFTGSQNRQRLFAQGRRDVSELGAAYAFASYGPGYTYDSGGDLIPLGGLYRDEIIAYNVEDPNIGMVRLTWSRTNAWTNGNPASGGTPAEAIYSVNNNVTSLIRDPAYAQTKVSISSDGTKLLYNTTWTGEGTSPGPYGSYDKAHHFVIDLVQAGLFTGGDPPNPVDSGAGNLQWAARAENSRSFVSCSGVGAADSIGPGCEIKNYTLIPTADFFRNCTGVGVSPCPPFMTSITEVVGRIEGMIWHGTNGDNTMPDGSTVPSGQGPFWDKLVDHEDGQYAQTSGSNYLERELIVVMKGSNRSQVPNSHGPEDNVKWKDVTKIRKATLKVWFDNVQPQHFDLLPSDGTGTEVTLYKNIKNYDPLVTQNIGDFFATDHVKRAISYRTDSVPRDQLPSTGPWDVERNDAVPHNSDPSSCPANYDGTCNILTANAFAVGIRRLSWDRNITGTSSDNVIAAVESIDIQIQGVSHFREIVLIADQTWAAGAAGTVYWDTDSENQIFAANLYPENNPILGKNGTGYHSAHVNVICLHDFHGPLAAPRNGGYFGDTTGANLAFVKCLYESDVTFPNAGGLRVLERVELNSSGTSTPTPEGYAAGTAKLAWITCPRQPPSNTDVENIKSWLKLHDHRLVISYEYDSTPTGNIASGTYRDKRQECENVNLLLEKLGATMRIAEDGSNSTPPQYSVTNGGTWKSSKTLSTGQLVSGATHPIVHGRQVPDGVPYNVLQLQGTTCIPVADSSISINGPVGGIKFGGVSPIDPYGSSGSSAAQVLMVAGSEPGAPGTSQPGTKILGMHVELEVEVCEETTTTTTPPPGTTTTTTPPTTTTTTIPPQNPPAGILLGNIGMSGFGAFTAPGIGPLDPVPPPPYPYPDPSPPVPIPHLPVVVEPCVLHSTANESTRLLLERDLFDPNRKIDGKTKTIQSIAVSKGYNLSNYTPYQRMSSGLEKVLYSEKIKTGMSIVLIDNKINVQSREKRLLSNIAAREILPARMKWPEE